jgi:hypothetical protein
MMEPWKVFAFHNKFRASSGNFNISELYHLNSIKKILIPLFIAMIAGAFQVAVAEEAAPAAKQSAASPAQTVVTHLDAALSFLVGKGDLSNAQPHIKAALDAARGVTGDPAVVKQGWDAVVNARTETKRGNPGKAIQSINDAVKIYKTL